MKKATFLLIMFFLLKILVQDILVSPVYELHRDEFLYLDQANHPAWGFRSVPPFTSWISWLILQLGNTFFWIRFFPALFGALTIVVVWKTIKSLGGNLFSCCLTSTALLFSTSFLRLNMLFHANSVDIFCWTLTFYMIIRFVQTQKPKWIYWMALVFAMGFLNKYNIVFLFIGLLAALLLSPERRRLFSKIYFYKALLLALILISPNIIWQFKNNFPVFRHLEELSSEQLSHIHRLDFITEQVYFFLGSVFILLFAFISFFKHKPFQSYRFIFWTYLFTIIIFIGLRAKAYYAFGLYPMFFAFGAIYLSELTQKGKLYYLRYIAIGIILLTFVPLMKVTMPVYPPQHYIDAAKAHQPLSTHVWEDGQKNPLSQDFADMLGWKELAQKVDSVYLSTSNKDRILVFCDNYGQAGAINYYSKAGITAYSFNADYLDWFHIDNEIKTVIRIKEKKHQDLSIEYALFNTITNAGKIENKYAREKGAWISVLTDPKMNIKQALHKEIQQLKGN